MCTPYYIAYQRSRSKQELKRVKLRLEFVCHHWTCSNFYKKELLGLTDFTDDWRCESMKEITGPLEQIKLSSEVVLMSILLIVTQFQISYGQDSNDSI